MNAVCFFFDEAGEAGEGEEGGMVMKGMSDEKKQDRALPLRRPGKSSEKCRQFATPQSASTPPPQQEEQAPPSLSIRPGNAAEPPIGPAGVSRCHFGPRHGRSADEDL